VGRKTLTQSIKRDKTFFWYKPSRLYGYTLHISKDFRYNVRITKTYRFRTGLLIYCSSNKQDDLAWFTISQQWRREEQRSVSMGPPGGSGGPAATER